MFSSVKTFYFDCALCFSLPGAFVRSFCDVFVLSYLDIYGLPLSFLSKVCLRMPQYRQTHIDMNSGKVCWVFVIALLASNLCGILDLVKAFARIFELHLYICVYVISW